MDRSVTTSVLDIPADPVINVMEVHNEPLTKITFDILPRRHTVRRHGNYGFRRR